MTFSSPLKIDFWPVGFFHGSLTAFRKIDNQGHKAHCILMHDVTYKWKLYLSDTASQEGKRMMLSEWGQGRSQNASCTEWATCVCNHTEALSSVWHVGRTRKVPAKSIERCIEYLLDTRHCAQHGAPETKRAHVWPLRTHWTKQLSLHNHGMKTSRGIKAQVVMKPAGDYHGKIYTGDGMWIWSWTMKDCTTLQIKRLRLRLKNLLKSQSCLTEKLPSLACAQNLIS